MEGRVSPQKKEHRAGDVAWSPSVNLTLDASCQSKPPCIQALRGGGRRVERKSGNHNKSLFEINHADSWDYEKQFDNHSQTGPPLTLKSEVFPWKGKWRCDGEAPCNNRANGGEGRERRRGARTAIMEGLLDNITFQNIKVTPIKKLTFKLLFKRSSLGW